MSMGLTKRQSELHQFLGAHLAAHGFAPSFREIAVAMDWNSLAIVHQAIMALMARGVLTYSPSIARSIKLIEPVGHDPRDCSCDGCSRVRIRAHQTFIEALHVPAPIFRSADLKALGHLSRTCWAVGFPYSDNDRAKPRLRKRAEQSQPQTVPAQVPQFHVVPQKSSRAHTAGDS